MEGDVRGNLAKHECDVQVKFLECAIGDIDLGETSDSSSMASGGGYNQAVASKYVSRFLNLKPATSNTPFQQPSVLEPDIRGKIKLSDGEAYLPHEKFISRETSDSSSMASGGGYNQAVASKYVSRFLNLKPATSNTPFQQPSDTNAERKGEFRRARCGLVYAPQIPSLLYVDLTVDPLKSLASDISFISFGTEVEVQLRKRHLQDSTYGNAMDIDLPTYKQITSSFTVGSIIAISTSGNNDFTQCSSFGCKAMASIGQAIQVIRLKPHQSPCRIEREDLHIAPSGASDFLFYDYVIDQKQEQP
ncbi:hypothetical protein L6452_15663 [Arctium lappa]|uniref:Uncharacterized protein n=1 Tax=Arctium lappa TaxID=4217 RepID=A0ACB9CPB2_ARCLA|nr:hypothetical protein L6452_15663 [Arctium lappa]